MSRALVPARSPLLPLIDYLELGTPEVARFVINCFGLYALEFLSFQHGDALDPDLDQIEARVHLTMEHRPVGWLWTQRTDEAMQLWGQEEHAAAFVLRVLDYLVNKGLLCSSKDDDGDVDVAVYEIHRRLCILQSLWLGNGVWVRDRRLEDELRSVLLRAME